MHPQGRWERDLIQPKESSEVSKRWWHLKRTFETSRKNRSWPGRGGWKGSSLQKA